MVNESWLFQRPCGKRCWLRVMTSPPKDILESTGRGTGQAAILVERHGQRHRELCEELPGVSSHEV